MTQKEPQDSILYQTGCVVILTIAACYMLATLGFAAGIPLSLWTFPAAFVTASLICINGNLKHTLISTAAAAAVILLSIAAVCRTADYSYDGNAYHQTTIVFLMNGWNPFVETTPNGLTEWGVHYAKGFETVSAAIALTTSHLEWGRAANLMLILGTALMAYPLIGSLTSSRHAALLTTLIAMANPVGTSQLFTYYIDFPKYYLTLVVILTLITTGKEKLTKREGFRQYALLFMTLAFGIGIKFNVAPDLALTMLFGIIYHIREKERAKAYTLLATGILAATAGIFIFGYNPYVTNYLSHGNPLYPLLGSDSIDIMTGNTPEVLLDGNRFTNFIVSLTHTGNTILPYYSTRLGGFSLLMPFLLIISAAAFIIWRKRIPAVYPAAALTAFLSCFLFEQSWWARYTTQLWLVPCTAALGCEVIKSRRAHLTGSLICTAGIVAGIIASLSGLHHTLLFREYREDIFKTAQSQGSLIVSERDPVLERHALEHGVRTEVSDTTAIDEETVLLPFSGYATIEPPGRIMIDRKARDAMRWVPDW